MSARLLRQRRHHRVCVGDQHPLPGGPDALSVSIHATPQGVVLGTASWLVTATH